jgi:hypothetical protein
MNIVDAQGNMLMTTRINFSDLMTSVMTLRENNTANNSDIATQKAVDTKQDVKIDKLDTNIHRIEGEVAELTRNLDLLKLRVTRLPSLDELKESL